MKVKTITAPTIHAALMEARRHLGDEVVLLESIPPSGDELARITVMADARAHTKTAAASVGSPTQKSSGATAVQTRGFGYQRAPVTAAVAVEENAFRHEQVAVGGGTSYPTNLGGRTLEDLLADRETAGVEARHRRGAGGPAARGQLFPTGKDLVRESNLPVSAAPVADLERVLEAQLALLHDRLDRLERRFSGAIIGAAQAWTTHPLFGSMLRHGFRPSTVTRLFDVLASKGFHPETDAETLKWALAQEIRRSIDLTVIPQSHGAHVFVGPSGAGKTSLLLKLAKHSGFFGRKAAAVIVIEPEEEPSEFHISPVDVFRRHGLPVQAVRSVEEMEAAVTRVQHFDHILIDSPALSSEEERSRKQLRHIKRLVDPIMPLRVQFVVNATRAIEDFDPESLRRLALRPEAVALTHLDEAQGWGRIGEWLMSVKMPVQFISTSAIVPDGVSSFSPGWFVEEMMKL